MLLIMIAIASFIAGHQYAKTDNTFADKSTAITEPEVQAILRINPNLASEQELVNLPGIGPVMAKRIIEHRQSLAFENIDDLLSVKGIGPKMLEKIRPHISLEE